MVEMKSVRKVDELGRIVLPRDMREYLNCTQKSYVRVQVHDNSIYLTKTEETDETSAAEPVRKIDELGRVLLPKEMRKKLAWEAKDYIKIQITENAIILEKLLK